MSIGKLLTPNKALAIGGVCYGAWAVWMAQNYFKNSSMRKIYVTADEKYRDVHPMRHIQYDGNLQLEK
ncbi:hypothetical protein PVL30_000848 [Lodderomyces elongisporus]|uniref:uncharacterized protein n=1 Tax=Lodderomyces elongisporus TaxID=36914 RepID=UPI0029204AAE|nr:uncharacterized protein PVL30_000848 [Lodderomyces elongisporus]WLF77139.1 hypothetical protein PVL30_000848 [Lodderomyces elongisporus]